MLEDKNFIHIAAEIATASKCVSKRVGAVIEKEGRIISTGYNGSPKGHINCDELFEEWSKDHHIWSHKYEIHAEMNALIWAARKGISIEGGTIYVTLEPCDQCTKNLIAAGIKKIVYTSKYEHVNSEELRNFIEEHKIEYIYMPIEDEKFDDLLKKKWLDSNK